MSLTAATRRFVGDRAADLLESEVRHRLRQFSEVALPQRWRQFGTLLAQPWEGDVTVSVPARWISLTSLNLMVDLPPHALRWSLERGERGGWEALPRLAATGLDVERALEAGVRRLRDGGGGAGGSAAAATRPLALEPDPTWVRPASSVDGLSDDDATAAAATAGAVAPTAAVLGGGLRSSPSWSLLHRDLRTDSSGGGPLTRGGRGGLPSSSHRRAPSEGQRSRTAEGGDWRCFSAADLFGQDPDRPMTAKSHPINRKEAKRSADAPAPPPSSEEEEEEEEDASDASSHREALWDALLPAAGERYARDGRLDALDVIAP